MIPVLVAQEHSIEKKIATLNRGLRIPAKKLRQQQFPSGVPRLSPPARIYGQDDVVHSRLAENTVHVSVVFVAVLFGIKQGYSYQVGTSKNGNLLIYVIEIHSRLLKKLCNRSS